MTILDQLNECLRAEAIRALEAGGDRWTEESLAAKGKRADLLAQELKDDLISLLQEREDLIAERDVWRTRHAKLVSELGILLGLKPDPTAAAQPAVLIQVQALVEFHDDTVKLLASIEEG
jgi:hypothetical protein